MLPYRQILPRDSRLASLDNKFLMWIEVHFRYIRLEDKNSRCSGVLSRYDSNICLQRQIRHPELGLFFIIKILNVQINKIKKGLPAFRLTTVPEPIPRREPKRICISENDFIIYIRTSQMYFALVLSSV